MKFPFNLVEHFPLFKHLLTGQLKSIQFYFSSNSLKKLMNTLTTLTFC